MEAFRFGAIVAAIVALTATGCGHVTPGGRIAVLPQPGQGHACLGHDLARIEHNRLATFRLDIKPGGHGTGVVISKEGHLLTAYHVVDDAEGLEITMVESNGKVKTYEAKVVAVDKLHDLAVVKIDRRFKNPAVLADYRCVRPGQAIYNVGYPHSLGEMVGRGSVMRLHWNETFKSGTKIKDAIVVDVKDGPGTSGSAVFSASTGQVIGILTTKVWYSGRAPATVIHAIRSSKYVAALLDKAGVKYQKPGSCKDKKKRP